MSRTRRPVASVSPALTAYRDLVDRDERLVEVSLENGLTEIADEFYKLANDCAQSYGLLWETGQLHLAEDLRSKMRFWACIYRQEEKVSFYPQVVKAKSPSPQSEQVCVQHPAQATLQSDA